MHSLLSQSCVKKTATCRHFTWYDRWCNAWCMRDVKMAAHVQRSLGFYNVRVQIRTCWTQRFPVVVMVTIQPHEWLEAGFAVKRLKWNLTSLFLKFVQDNWKTCAFDCTRDDESWLLFEFCARVGLSQPCFRNHCDRLDTIYSHPSIWYWDTFGFEKNEAEYHFLYSHNSKQIVGKCL